MPEYSDIVLGQTKRFLRGCEFSSCSCLTALPGPAWVLLSKTLKPFRPTQYNVSRHLMVDGRENKITATFQTDSEMTKT